MSMEKEVNKSSQHLVKLMLDKEIKHDKTRFSDVDIDEFKNKIRTKKMLDDLELRTAEIEKLKEIIKE